MIPPYYGVPPGYNTLTFNVISYSPVFVYTESITWSPTAVFGVLAETLDIQHGRGGQLGSVLRRRAGSGAGRTAMASPAPQRLLRSASPILRPYRSGSLMEADT